MALTVKKDNTFYHAQTAKIIKSKDAWEGKNITHDHQFLSIFPTVFF